MLIVAAIIPTAQIQVILVPRHFIFPFIRLHLRRGQLPQRRQCVLQQRFATVLHELLVHTVVLQLLEAGRIAGFLRGDAGAFRTARLHVRAAHDDNVIDE